MKRQGQSKRKIVIGLTGSFGSGKTTVARIFRSLGTEIIDADKIAHALLKPPGSIYKKIRKIFGKEVIWHNRQVNRAALAKIVFNHRSLLKRLNRIIHPAVIRSIKKRIKAAAGRIAVLDAPLLIEARLAGAVDKLIVVTVTREKQIKRIRNKTGLGRQEILKRIKAQLPLRQKVRLADFVIDNSGTIGKTMKQVKAIRRLLWKS